MKYIAVKSVKRCVDLLRPCTLFSCNVESDGQTQRLGISSSPFQSVGVKIEQNSIKRETVFLREREKLTKTKYILKKCSAGHSQSFKMG